MSTFKRFWMTLILIYCFLAACTIVGVMATVISAFETYPAIGRFDLSYLHAVVFSACLGAIAKGICYYNALFLRKKHTEIYQHNMNVPNVVVSSRIKTDMVIQCVLRITWTLIFALNASFLSTAISRGLIQDTTEPILYWIFLVPGFGILFFAPTVPVGTIRTLTTYNLKIGQELPSPSEDSETTVSLELASPTYEVPKPPEESRL